MVQCFDSFATRLDNVSDYLSFVWTDGSFTNRLQDC